MERKRIQGTHRARLPVGKWDNARNCSNEYKHPPTPVQRNLKRNSDHLLTRGPPAKIYLGVSHQAVRSLSSAETNPALILGKRVHELDSAHTKNCNEINRVPGKLPKTEIEDDVEEMRKKFEQWDSDSDSDTCKENIAKPVEASKGPKVWHIEAYIEQNVYDEATDQETE